MKSARSKSGLLAVLLTAAAASLAAQFAGHPEALASMAEPPATCAPRQASSLGSGQRQAEQVNLEIAQLRQQGKTPAEIDSKLQDEMHLERISEPSPQPSAKRKAYSTNLDITVPAPTVYYNECFQYAFVVAEWHFNSIRAIITDVPWACHGRCNIGGADGFGVAFNRPVDAASGYDVITWGNTSWYAKATTRMAVNTANTTGVSFVGQDTVCVPGAPIIGPVLHCKNDNPDYNVYNGQLTYMIGSIGCGPLQAFSTYAHSWSSTAVNGISVGIDSLGVSWSSSDNNWSHGSQPSNVRTPLC